MKIKDKERLTNKDRKRLEICIEALQDSKAPSINFILEGMESYLSERL